LSGGLPYQNVNASVGENDQEIIAIKQEIDKMFLQKWNVFMMQMSH
jgi:hypothetical protein